MKHHQPSYDHLQHTVSQNRSTKFVVIAVISLFFLTIVPLFYPNSLSFYSFHSTRTNDHSSDNNTKIITKTPSSPSTKDCDIFSGKWIRNPDAPYYTNNTCRAIHEHQNCMKYGRPDSDFMKWRWKPDDCEFPVFNPAQFLELMRDKSLAFVGDSVSRNQMQSLICLLSRIEYPTNTSDKTDEFYFKRWKYITHNFTLAFFWTPHLVKGRDSNPNGPKTTAMFDLFLDEFDESWTSRIASFDHLVISSGHWFYSAKVFYENRTIVGCHNCRLPNVTDLGMFYGYRKALHTAFEAINSHPGYGGITFFRTFAPSHFDNGKWYEGGDCTMTKPFRGNETALVSLHLEMYKTQVEEFRAAEMVGRRRGLKFRLLNTTYAALLRPDGHPSRYGHWADKAMYNDCVHWCLPGPIDTWNDFLLEIIKTET